MNISAFWNAVLQQDAAAIRPFFHPDAYINWHCTNEHFTVDEFIQANCDYPGQWSGTVERVETMDDLLITAVHVFSAEDSALSFHVVSFFRLVGDRIVSVDEYWGDDGPAPLWRLEKRIGTPIHPSAP